VSFGYLALFLKIEPHAYQKFCELFCLGPSGREVNMSKDTFGRAAGSSNGSTSTPSGQARSLAEASSASGATGDGHGALSAPDTAHTAETLSTNAYAARESSLYNMQQQTSVGASWLGASSLFRREREEEDERDEADLLNSINSESLPGPARLSFLNMSMGRDDDGPVARDSRGSLVSSVKSALRPLFPSSGNASPPAPSHSPTAAGSGAWTATGAGSGMSTAGNGAAKKTVTLNLSLQSSTTSPMVALAGLREPGSGGSAQSASDPSRGRGSNRRAGPDNA
jgi:hypothetical protein